MWVSDSDCRKVISRAWDCTLDGTPMFATTKKLKRCKKRLKAWSQDHFGNVQKNIKQIKDRLWMVEEVSTKTRVYEDVVRLKTELSDFYDKEEMMWQQRSQIQWLKSGDQNTKFFHGLVTQRKRRNFIKGLRDANGVWQEDEEVFSTLLNDFYTQLFTSSSPQD